MPEAIDKLDDHAINIAEKTVVHALETCYMEHNKAFYKRRAGENFERTLVIPLDWFFHL